MRKLPPLNELRAFEAAARHLSFRNAAAELGVTPTAISHQVRALEAYCKLSLFRRRPRPMTLTDAGARLFLVVRDGLDSFSTIIAAVKRDRDRQPLRVTTTNAFAGRWLVPRLAGWRKERPDIPLEVIGTDSVLDLEAEEADVAIRYALKAPSDGPSIELFRDQFWPVCTPALAANMRNPGRARDLRGQVLIHCYWSPADRTAPTWQRWLKAAGKRWRDVPDFAECQHPQLPRGGSFDRSRDRRARSRDMQRRSCGGRTQSRKAHQGIRFAAFGLWIFPRVEQSTSQGEGHRCFRCMAPPAADHDLRWAARRDHLRARRSASRSRISLLAPLTLCNRSSAKCLISCTSCDGSSAYCSTLNLGVAIASGRRTREENRTMHPEKNYKVVSRA